MNLTEWKQLMNLSGTAINIDDIPGEIDVAPVRHGKWILEQEEYGYGNWNRWKCSCCGYVRTKGWAATPEGHKPKAMLCENCGAKMDAERKDEYVTLHHEDINFINDDAERAFYESLSERKSEWTEHEALDYIITYIGCATFGKGRWFRQSDGTYYDRLFEDYVDLGIVAMRVVETVRERKEE